MSGLVKGALTLNRSHWTHLNSWAWTQST